jgi:hypothetical protein
MPDPYTCGACRGQFDEKKIVPHMKTMHPGVGDDLKQWPDGSIAVGPIEDVDLFVPTNWWEPPA